MSGLYGKYRVTRTDGQERPSARYFVLDYANDPHALVALRAYADACDASGDRPELVADLRWRVLGQIPGDRSGRVSADDRAKAVAYGRSVLLREVQMMEDWADEAEQTGVGKTDWRVISNWVRWKLLGDGEGCVVTPFDERFVDGRVSP